MTSTETLIAERDAATAALAAAKLELGQAIRANADGDRAQAAQKVTEADAALTAINFEIEALRVAEADAASKAQEEADKEAERVLAARLKAAEADLAKLRKAGGKVDKALADLDAAMRAMDATAKAYLAEHEALGVHQAFKDWANRQGWVRPIAAYILYRGNADLRRYMRNAYIDHFAGNVRENVPDFSSVLTGRRKKPVKVKDHTWRDVLDVADGEIDRDGVEAAYRALARERHPDAGGTDADMVALNAARDAALAEIGGA